MPCCIQWGPFAPVVTTCRWRMIAALWVPQKPAFPPSPMTATHQWWLSWQLALPSWENSSRYAFLMRKIWCTLVQTRLLTLFETLKLDDMDENGQRSLRYWIESRIHASFAGHLCWHYQHSLLHCFGLVVFFSERFVAKKLSYWIEEIPFVGKFFGTWLQSRLFDTLITQLLCPSVEKNAVLVDGHRKSQGLQLWYFGPFGVMNNCFAWYNYTISWCEMSCAKYPPSITKLSWLLGADNLDVEVPSIQHHCCHFSHNLPWRPHIQGCQNRLQKGRVFSGKKILPASRGWRSTLVGVTGFHQELRLFDSWISLQESWAAGIGIFEIGPLGPWGYPCDGCPQNHWLNGWTLAVWNHVNIWQNFQKWTLLRHVILRDFKWKLKDKTLFFFQSTTACPVATFQIVIL